ncbi:MAG TPA: septum formation initiator family protein [bacterium]|nr:septum formation initiator family protein [bacterium]
MKNSQRKWIGALLVLAGIYLFIGGNRGLWNLYKLHEDKAQLQKEVGQLKADIMRGHAEYQAYQNDPSVIEKQAREELNLAKPGEIIYRFSAAPSEH